MAIKGHIPWNKGVKTGLPGGRHCPLGCTCKRHDVEMNKRKGEKCRRFRHSKESSAKISLAKKGMVFSEQHKESLKAASPRRKMSEEQRELRRRLWKDPEYVKKQMKARLVKPNLVELELLQLVQPFGFHYVGDGELIINGKCPDFWNGETKLIELYGNYWHRNHNTQDRIDMFHRHGYDCLVIWENELSNRQVLVESLNLYATSPSSLSTR